MVLHRCHYILASDAGCHEKMEFQDLGNAIRKIRIDLGIDITIKLDRLEPLQQNGRSSGHYAVGSIHYNRVDHGASDGILIYLNPLSPGTRRSMSWNTAPTTINFLTNPPRISSSTNHSLNRTGDLASILPIKCFHVP